MDSPKGFEKPNHTQTPNSFFDVSLRQITSMPELKVVLAIIRKTLGWQKEKDKISMSQIAEMTGLGRQSVQRGIDQALMHGFIEREPAGNQFFYSLKIVTPRDQSHHVTSHKALPEIVTPRDQKVVTPCDTQKKGKEKKESTAFAALMKHHADRVGKILDGGKQGKAVKAILAAGFSAEDAIACYQWATGWSDAPDWSLIQGKIGSWLAQRRDNGTGPKLDVSERAAKEAAAKKKMGWDKLEQRTA